MSVRTHSRRAQRRVAEFYPYASKREHDALKREAHRIVASALADGSLVRQPCEKCGRKAEGHHDDYSKPLDIRWLCRYHHRQRDAELRDAWRGRIRALRKDALPVAYLKRLARLERLHKAPVENPDQVLQAFPKRSYRSTLLSKECSLEVVRQATITVADAMDAERVSERELARRIGTSRQNINQAFAGGFRTLKLIAACAEALGYEASLVLRRRVQREVAS